MGRGKTLVQALSAGQAVRNMILSDEEKEQVKDLYFFVF